MEDGKEKKGAWAGRYIGSIKAVTLLCDHRHGCDVSSALLSGPRRLSGLIDFRRPIEFGPDRLRLSFGVACLGRAAGGYIRPTPRPKRSDWMVVVSQQASSPSFLRPLAEYLKTH